MPPKEEAEPSEKRAGTPASDRQDPSEMSSGVWSWLRVPVYLVGSLASLGTGALYYYQNEIIYPRNLPAGTRTEVPRPKDFGIEDAEELFIPTPDGETLSAYLLKPPIPRLAKPVTILMFHGNAGNIGHRLPIARALSDELSFTVLMVDYRGYGRSTGDPNEKGLNIDAQTALDHIRQRQDLRGHKVVIYGQSLGGAVGINLVVRNKGAEDIRGLILENTFLSIAKLVPSLMPAARYFTPLLHEHWRSEAIISQITDVPILFLSGLKDEIVPPSHMRQLFRLARSNNVHWKELPNGDHNSSVAEPGYFLYIEDFIKRQVL